MRTKNVALPELRSSVLMLWTDIVAIVILQGNRVSSIITSTFSTYKISQVNINFEWRY